MGGATIAGGQASEKEGKSKMKLKRVNLIVWLISALAAAASAQTKPVNNSMPSWHPDGRIYFSSNGKRVVFVAGDFPNTSIVVADANGANQVKIMPK